MNDNNEKDELLCKGHGKKLKPFVLMIILIYV